MGWIWDGAGSVFTFVADVVMQASVSDQSIDPSDFFFKNQNKDPLNPAKNFVEHSPGVGYALPQGPPVPYDDNIPDLTVAVTVNDAAYKAFARQVQTDTHEAQLDLDITPAATAYTNASTFAEAWAAQTFTATLDADYSPAATAYTNASAFAETWAAATFTATLDADNGPAAVAYTDAYGWGETWAGTTFTARFSADVSPLETALVRVRQIAQEISDLLPNSPAKKGPLARPVSFGYIADALSADLGGMPGVTTDLMSRVRNGLDIGWPDGAMGLAGMGAAGNGFTNNGVVHIDADDPEGLWDALRRQGLAGVRP
jgi:hypothetical protein